MLTVEKESDSVINKFCEIHKASTQNNTFILSSTCCRMYSAINMSTILWEASYTLLLQLPISVYFLHLGLCHLYYLYCFRVMNFRLFSELSTYFLYWIINDMRKDKQISTWHLFMFNWARKGFIGAKGRKSKPHQLGQWKMMYLSKEKSWSFNFILTEITNNEISVMASNIWECKIRYK